MEGTFMEHILAINALNQSQWVVTEMKERRIATLLRKQSPVDDQHPQHHWNQKKRDQKQKKDGHNEKKKNEEHYWNLSLEHKNALRRKKMC